MVFLKVRFLNGRGFIGEGLKEDIVSTVMVCNGLKWAVMG